MKKEKKQFLKKAQLGLFSEPQKCKNLGKVPKKKTEETQISSFQEEVVKPLSLKLPKRAQPKPSHKCKLVSQLNRGEINYVKVTFLFGKEKYIRKLVYKKITDNLNEDPHSDLIFMERVKQSIMSEAKRKFKIIEIKKIVSLGYELNYKK
jgi:hypothetical protein